MTSLNLLGMFGLCLSLILIIHLWVWRKGPPRWKLLWTALLCFVFVGPIFYFAFYDPPRKRSLEELKEISKSWKIGIS